jgi:hypothetical protein
VVLDAAGLSEVGVLALCSRGCHVKLLEYAAATRAFGPIGQRRKHCPAASRAPCGNFPNRQSTIPEPDAARTPSR